MTDTIKVTAVIPIAEKRMVLDFMITAEPSVTPSIAIGGNNILNQDIEGFSIFPGADSILITPESIGGMIRGVR
ncbi:hypothetical protein D3C78_1548470 [compost metagenome]